MFLQIDSGSAKSSATATKQQMEELKILRDALVANFRWDLLIGIKIFVYFLPLTLLREQMKLRHRLMEIDNHILGLTMEFERQNMIVTQWEMDKAK